VHPEKPTSLVGLPRSTYKAIEGMAMIKPLTKDERGDVRWFIWEPMRRHVLLRAHYVDLFLYNSRGKRVAHNLDPVNPDVEDKDDLEYREDVFCKKYSVPYPVDPDTPFEEINDPEWYFFERYSPPRYEEVVSLDLSYSPDRWLVHGCLLPLLIHTGHSQNNVVKALEKELNDWWRKWKTFYKEKRQPKAPPVQVGETVGPYQRVFVNLAAPRGKIVDVIKGLPHGPQGIQLPRHNFKRMKRAFELWDSTDPLSLLAAKVAARKFNIPKRTAYDMLNMVSQLIYGVSFLRSRPLRQLASKKVTEVALPGREVEVALLNDYQGDITVCCPVPALVDEILAIPDLRKPKRDPLQDFKKFQRIEDRLIRAIDLKTEYLRWYAYEEITSVTPHSLRVGSCFLIDEFTNFVKRGSDETQTNHPCSVKSSESHRR